MGALLCTHARLDFLRWWCVILVVGCAEWSSASTHNAAFFPPTSKQLSVSAAAASILPQPQPYRPAFHFQPFYNLMNDPSGPMFYNGYYHVFYQWNPYSPIWGNITWGHAVSLDMLHWNILELALVPSQWYDQYGCWAGSSTIVNGKPVLLYTGWTNASFSVDNEVQMQAMAVAANYSDPLLREWIKIPQNPILKAPPGINSTKFRDPSTAWLGADGRWRLLIGAKKKHRGVALLYKSSDFVHWEIAKHPLHSVAITGMWECPDFYPVPASASRQGLDTSTTGPDVKHVLKVSLDDTRHDHYAVGTYIPSKDLFSPSNAKIDAGIGLRYNYGKFYASKTFYDDNKGRRILLGLVNESSSRQDTIAKGWSSMQAFPRVVWLDGENNERLLQWPIEEIESLREENVTLGSVPVEPGALFEVKEARGTQLDVEIDFAVPDLTRAEGLEVNLSNAQQICIDRGISRKGVVGPFGLLALASDDQAEQTAVFFYIVSSGNGSWSTLVCSDQSRSSYDTDLDKTTYGSFIPITNKEKALSLRVLVDHSIVETFAQGGKLCITSRVYPTKAIDNGAHLFVFNNGSVPIQVLGLTAWKMRAIHIGGSR